MVVRSCRYNSEARRISTFTETSQNVAFSDDNLEDYRDSDVNSKGERIDIWSPGEGVEDIRSLTENNDEYIEETPKKRVRIRVPVVRKNTKQHKLTVVRRRPLVLHTEDPPLNVASHTPRRIVVTRIRTLGLANSIRNEEPESSYLETGRHKVTITRRRKIGVTPVLPTTTDKRGRITRRKLIAVRPVEPTPSFAIITTGFFTAPSSEYGEEYIEEDDDDAEDSEQEVSTTVTPELTEAPNVIDNKPVETEREGKAEDTETKVLEETSVNEPVIITDNFFFRPSADEYDYDDEYVKTTTAESVNESSKDEGVLKSTRPLEVEESVGTNKDATTTTSEASNVPERGEIPTEKSVDTFDGVSEDEAVTEPLLKQDAKSDELLTTMKPVEGSTTLSKEENVTAQAESFDTTLPEDSSTTPYPEIREEDEDEKEPTTTIESVEATASIDETTVITIPEEQPQAIPPTEEETIYTTTEKADTNDITEYPVPSTESSELQMQPEIEDSSPKDAGRSLEKETAPNITSMQTVFKESSQKDIADSPQKNVESHVTTTVPIVEPETESPSRDMEDFNVLEKAPETTTKAEEKAEVLTVQPIQPVIEPTPTVSSSASSFSSDITPSFASVLPLETPQLTTQDSAVRDYFDDSEIPSVIPLEVEYTPSSEVKRTSEVLEPTPSLDVAKVTISISSPTPEDIEAGLADDLYLSLSRPDFPEILSSKPTAVEHQTISTPNLEPSTSIYYTETVVTSTRLRTYTYVITQQNGLETKVTSSTTVRPRVTTLTLTVPVTVTVTPTVESSANFVSSVYNPVPVLGE